MTGRENDQFLNNFAVTDFRNKVTAKSRRQADRQQREDAIELLAQVLRELGANNVTDLEACYAPSNKNPEKWCQVLDMDEFGSLETDPPLKAVRDKRISDKVNIRAVQYGTLKFRRARK